MSKVIPIRVEKFQLAQLGIPTESIRFGLVTMESDKFMCVNHKINNGSHAYIIDVETKNIVMKRPASADSLIMNPVSNILAVKCFYKNNNSSKIQIINLDNKRVVKSVILPYNVSFWKWISSTTLSLVAEMSVYHWNINDVSDPVKIFDKLPPMDKYEINDYRTNPTHSWVCLAALERDNNIINCKLQLYSVERKCSQLISGYAPCFVEFKMAGNASASDLICFVENGSFRIIEVGNPQEGNKPYPKKKVNFSIQSEVSHDIPIMSQGSPRHGLVYVTTMFGYLYLYDLETATCIYVCCISSGTLFASVIHETTGGIIVINNFGHVLSISLDESKIVEYLINVLQNPCLAGRFVTRNNLTVSEELFITKFNELFEGAQYQEAAIFAATSPYGILRTPEILNKFMYLQHSLESNTRSSLSYYFDSILEFDHPNKFESLILCRILVSKGRMHDLKNMLVDQKLEFSEDLGDLMLNTDPEIALSIYLRASVPNKVVHCFAILGEFEKLVQYAHRVNYSPDYLHLLKKTIELAPDRGVEFAKFLTTMVEFSVDLIANVFLEKKLIKHFTTFLIDSLKEDKASEGYLQTKLLEINLINAPHVADAILANQMYTHYDRNHIAYLCEKHGLFKRALEHYTELVDIKRVILLIQFTDSEWLINYFGTLSVDDAMQCLHDILSSSNSNLNVCVQIVCRYYKELTINAIIKLFESFNLTENIFHFLHNVLEHSEDQEVYLKYIEVACDLGHMKEVERICRDSNVYCPEKVKNYLKCARLSDHLALLIVCDRHNFIHDLIVFLYLKKNYSFIKTFVKNVNPGRLPEVIGELLDLDAEEEFLTSLISDVTGRFSQENLISEVEKRKRLVILKCWLENLVKEGSVDPIIHNAIGKIYIDNNLNAQNFLKDNQFYDGRVIGKYCEQRDPSFACIAYEKSHCHSELLNLLKVNSMAKEAARYLIHQKEPSLWSEILSDRNGFREKVVEEVINFHSIVSNTQDPEEIYEIVKAFMAADLIKEVIDFLDNFLSSNDLFCKDTKLQDILIMSAMKVEKGRVLEFIQKFNNYSAEYIANCAVNNEHYEEAFQIYKKFKINDSAINILVKYFDNLEKAVEFARNCNDIIVWNKLGEAQLLRGLTKDAINSFIMGKNTLSCQVVVEAAHKSENWEDLVEYLEMAAMIGKDSYIESELIYAYVKLNELVKLEEYISKPNNADINRIGERCYNNGMYEASKLLFSNIFNFQKLAATMVKLNEFQGAVENASKAKQIDTWKEVCFACIEKKEFVYAQICALHIVVNAEEIDKLVNFYIGREYFDEIIKVLEVGLTSQGTHMGQFTHLAILYTKHRPEQLKEYLELFWSRINIPKVLRAAEDAHMWKEAVFLHEKSENYDHAACIIMEHPTETWNDMHFKDIVLKVTNNGLHFKCIQFYLDYKPLLLNNFLLAIAHKLDNPKAVAFLSEAGILPVVKEYLLVVQYLNNQTINDAVNGLFISEENFQDLGKSILSYDNFNSKSLTLQLVNHELTEFKRLAVVLFKLEKKWSKCIEICKEYGLFSDAIECASESGLMDVAEDLLEWFLVKDKMDFFAICLFQCFDLLLPGTVLELAWRYNKTDLAMPYLIQTIQNYTRKLDSLIAMTMEDQQQKHQQVPAGRCGMLSLTYQSSSSS